MALKVVAALCLSAVALARPDKHPDPYHPEPYHPVPEYPEVPAKYDFNYNVADDYSKANFQHSENRDGYKTEGSYSVDLPDGRRQTVNYVDNGEGLEAVVTYEGEAQSPEYKPAPSHAEPAPYHPEPHYQPAPYHPEPAPYHAEPAPYHPAPSYH